MAIIPSEIPAQIHDLINWDDHSRESSPIASAVTAGGDLISWDESESEDEEEPEQEESHAVAPSTPARRQSIGLTATPALADRVSQHSYTLER